MIYPSASYTYYQNFAVGGGTGAEFTWVVPADVTQIEVDMFGGIGGNGGNDSSRVGGFGVAGDVLTGYISVTPGQTIIISTGGNGGNGGSSAGGAAGGAGGASTLGYNGGRGGRSGTTGSSGGGGGGGGATVIRVGGIDYVAAGGGGGGGAGASGGGYGGDVGVYTTTIYGAQGTDKVGDGGGGGGGGGGVQGGAGGGTRTGDSGAWGGYTGSSSYGSLSYKYGSSAADGWVTIGAFGGSSILTINSGKPSHTVANSLNGWGTVAIGGTGTFEPATNVTGYNYSSRAPALILNSGGTFQSSNSFNTFDNVSLNGGIVRARGGMNSIYPSFMFRGTVSVTENTIIYHEPTGYNAFSGLMIGSNASVKSTTFNIASGKSLDIQTLVEDGSWGVSTPTEATKLIKTGSGTLKLGFANTYSGGTDISEGTIEVGNSNALGSGLVSMTEVKLSSISTNSYTLNNAFSISGNITIGGSENTGPLALAGVTTSAGNTTLNVHASSLTFSDFRLLNPTININNPGSNVSIEKLTLQSDLSRISLNNTTINLSRVVVNRAFSAGETTFLSVKKAQTQPSILLDSAPGLNSNQVGLLKSAVEKDIVKLQDVLIEGNVSFTVQTPIYLGIEYASSEIFSLFSYTGTLSGLSNLQVIPPAGYTLISVTDDVANKQVLVQLTGSDSTVRVDRYDYILEVKNT